MSSATPAFSRPARPAWVALGSNLGDRQATLERALEALGGLSDLPLLRSSIWESAPDDAEGGAFLNMVAQITTAAAPITLLEELLAIERRLGRQRPERPPDGPSAARTIDLDLLHVRGELARGARLSLPHPRMGSRAYVLAPLAEIAPDLVDARSGQRVDRLLAALACPPQKRPRIIGDRFHGSDSST